MRMPTCQITNCRDNAVRIGVHRSKDDGRNLPPIHKIKTRVHLHTANLQMMVFANGSNARAPGAIAIQKKDFVGYDSIEAHEEPPVLESRGGSGMGGEGASRFAST